jgi:peptidyl-tRNA hydrolase, PTH1 family
MGLFYKQELPQSGVLYTSGLESIKLIVGLGNVGKEYDRTRHNVGFMCADNLVELKQGQWSEKKALQALVADLREHQTRLIVIKPTTFMNLSGEAVQAVQHYFKVKNKDTLVIHDELDIDFGSLRIRRGGSSAGHNGIKSLIQHIGEDFTHIRIGIGPKKPAQIDSADFVLQKFSKEEQAELPTMMTEVNSIITEFIYGSELPAETRKFIL